MRQYTNLLKRFTNLSFSLLIDFRKAGIAKRKQVKLAEFTSTSAESISSTSLPKLSDLENNSFSVSKGTDARFSNKVDTLANTIITKVLKDDVIDNNARKADQIQKLFNDLALGIVETVLEKPERLAPHKSPAHKIKTKTPKAQKTPNPPEFEKKKGPTSDILLEKALNRKSLTESKLDALSGNIVDRINERKSGSSRIASSNSYSSSDVANMTQGIIDKLPQQYSISPSEQSYEGEIADRVVPVDASPRSNTTGTSLGDQFIKAVVNQSIILGEEETVSGASSLAEEFVAKSIPYWSRI